MPSICLTGASGFIGSMTARCFLDAGWDVVAICRSGSNQSRLVALGSRLAVVDADLSNVDDLGPRLLSGRCEVCVHAAWPQTTGRYLSNASNDVVIDQMRRLGRAIAGAGCRRLILAGSAVVYAPGDVPSRESDPTSATTPYARAKQAVWEEAQRLGDEHRWSVVDARIFQPYGPGESTTRLVPSMIRALLRDEPVALTAGTQVRDFVHVEDVAAALVVLAQSAVEGVVNVGTGIGTPVRSVAEIVGRRLGRASRLEFGALEEAGEMRPFLVADSKRLMDECHWRPRFDLESGLEQTIAWWQHA
jgi:nucleoside-diphosphate-sugar epimerase